MNPTVAQQLVRDKREPIFDTYTLAKKTATPLRIILFGNSSTSGVGNVTPEQTNLTQVGQLGQGESHKVYAVRVKFIGMLAADIISFCEKFVMRIFVDGNEVMRMPLTPNPDNPRVVATIASDIIFSASCEVNLPDGYDFTIQGNNFYVDFVSSAGFTTTDTNGQGIYVRVELDGVHSVLA